MSLFNRFKKNQPVTEYTEERTIPKKDIISVQTFTQAKSFRGFRRVRISTYGLDGVEKNFAYFREKEFDFTNAAVQIMTVKANNDFGKCLRIVVDGRFIGNVYRSDSNAEAFDVEARDGKFGGGYCTTFAKYKQPFILANFNGTSGDIDVII